MLSLHANPLIQFHLLLGWSAVVLGVASGAVMGMCFHREWWLGGYGATPRRMIRLGHISFFGMAFLNFSFALTMALVIGDESLSRIGSGGLILATIAMPTVCFFSAFRGISRGLFSVPVSGTIMLMISVLLLLSR